MKPHGTRDVQRKSKSAPYHADDDADVQKQMNRHRAVDPLLPVATQEQMRRRGVEVEDQEDAGGDVEGVDEAASDVAVEETHRVLVRDAMLKRLVEDVAAERQDGLLEGFSLEGVLSIFDVNKCVV